MFSYLKVKQNGISFISLLIVFNYLLFFFFCSMYLFTLFLYLFANLLAFFINIIYFRTLHYTVIYSIYYIIYFYLLIENSRTEWFSWGFFNSFWNLNKPCHSVSGTIRCTDHNQCLANILLLWFLSVQINHETFKH